MTILFEFSVTWPGSTNWFLVSLLSTASFPRISLSLKNCWNCFSSVDFNTEILWKTFSGKTRTGLLMLVSLSNKNGFVTTPSYCTYPQNDSWKDSLSSWCFFKCTLIGSLIVSSNSERILAISVPIVSQRIKPDSSVLFNKYLAPPEPLIFLLFCSCVWSIASIENLEFVFGTRSCLPWILCEHQNIEFLTRLDQNIERCTIESSECGPEHCTIYTMKWDS